ncbi:EamA family transporter RarD [uncultured Oxalicibacterium sp.]|uniref:EamA family transporter RarD n=1 Tax=uncultured Oxalicibacterium sp. TaxID=1168540 RepID=UPI0025F7F8A2|nr:EamA family transporter RarD [uncultured Oxalicibacterium sp.]
MSKGILFSVIGSTLFAVLYYYATLLTPLDGEQIFGWRTLLTVPFLTAFIWWRGQENMVWTLARRMTTQPLLIGGALLTSALLGIQLWLFMWAPLHGRALNVSLGYFLLPLTMLLTGRLLYRERLTRWQNLAAVAAAIGVTNEFYHVGVLSWETMLVALGYPVYFVLRRKMDAANLGGLWFDMALLLPAGLWLIMTGAVGFDMISAHQALYGLIPLLGILSSMALVFYMLASQMLPMSLFGLLGYVEPVLLVLVALLLGETISGAQWMTYIPVWCAVTLLVIEGILNLNRRQIRKRK